MPFDHFNLIAGLFERTAKYIPPVLLLDLIDLRPNESLLDAGGGTGRIAKALREMVRAVVVADPSRGMLHYAAGKGLTSCCAPAEHIPFASNSFQRIIMVDAFHHLFNQEAVISEFWRVLVPDGKIVIVEPDIQRWEVKLIALGEKMMLMRSHFFSAEKITALLEKPGIKVRVAFTEMQFIVCAERVREM
jgi:Methylase involved in ubiquinone/menaquinone biosynthesis